MSIFCTHVIKCVITQCTSGLSMEKCAFQCDVENLGAGRQTIEDLFHQSLPRLQVCPLIAQHLDQVHGVMESKDQCPATEYLHIERSIHRPNKVAPILALLRSVCLMSNRVDMITKKSFAKICVRGNDCTCFRMNVHRRFHFCVLVTKTEHCASPKLGPKFRRGVQPKHSFLGSCQQQFLRSSVRSRGGRTKILDSISVVMKTPRASHQTKCEYSSISCCFT